MKISMLSTLLVSTTTSVLAFTAAPQQRPASALTMVSTSIPQSPDPYRRVPVPEETAGPFPWSRHDVMVEPDYFLAKDIAAMAPGLMVMYHPTIFPAFLGLSAATFHLALAAFLWSQTNRVRLVFGKDNFELFNLSNDGSALKEKPSNYVAGTVNSWTYDSVVDYGFYPSIEYPLIIYFKETATPKNQWGNFEYWGKFAMSTLEPLFGIDDIEGQPHFMPALMDVSEFVTQMEQRGVKARNL
eukprot:CAMPEP_0117035998 /NCGR_PEP_ID=MMETSP0472-20121206/25532_1 /TAXON_ID=693140 ORGANISM="Tiarina fusus, Strain LIS" /NCGR_SAMPLE_ID=MMETSP0472 /ASSEMBLY_ACC=CAM_ASM_000603 /LENGTH=241 /DNA_ID=CAMNT_0004745635 /DNA_START=97 /DNA_END=822 /DNA_ORIENTATION=+